MSPKCKVPRFLPGVPLSYPNWVALRSDTDDTRTRVSWGLFSTLPEETQEQLYISLQVLQTHDHLERVREGD